MAGVAADFVRIPSKKLTMFITGNVEDFEIYKKASQMISIWLGIEKETKYEPIFTRIKLNYNLLNYNQNAMVNPDLFVGFYLQEELKTVQEIYSRENCIFMNIKNIGEIPIVFMTGNQFKFGNIGSGRFLFEGNRVIGMIFIDIPRAPMIKWIKLANKPICLN
jgi:hypothetical protein